MTRHVQSSLLNQLYSSNDTRPTDYQSVYHDRVTRLSIPSLMKHKTCPSDQLVAHASCFVENQALPTAPALSKCCSTNHADPYTVVTYGRSLHGVLRKSQSQILIITEPSQPQDCARSLPIVTILAHSLSWSCNNLPGSQNHTLTPKDAEFDMRKRSLPNFPRPPCTLAKDWETS